MSKHKDQDRVAAFIQVYGLKDMPRPDIAKDASRELLQKFVKDDFPKSPKSKPKGQ